MAIRESNYPDQAASDADHAEIAVMGGIGLTVNSETRDGFIKAGFAYLQNFDQVADRAVEELEQDEAPRRGVILEIRELQERVKDVELDEFFQLLADDWDERYPEVDDDEHE